MSLRAAISRMSRTISTGSSARGDSSGIQKNGRGYEEIKQRSRVLNRAASLMVLVLVIGDLHIPYRTHDLPAKFKKLLVPGKIQQIICTGNVCDKETFEYLRTVSPDVSVVRGDYDDNPSYPLSLTIHHPPLSIGVIHGHQCIPSGDMDQLNAIARQMDVDVVLSGHTHVFHAQEIEGRFFLNPGSATGAWSGAFPTDPIPSFALLDIQGPIVTTYVYQLIDGEVRVEKIEYRKPLEVHPMTPRPPGAAVQVASPGRETVW